jgi:hypothetical protein
MVTFVILSQDLRCWTNINMVHLRFLAMQESESRRDDIFEPSTLVLGKREKR